MQIDTSLPPWALQSLDQNAPAPALGDLFSAPAMNWPDKQAVSDGSNSYSFIELEHRAQILASYLQAQGVVPGSRVAILAEKCALMPILAVAIWKCAAVYVPLDASQPEVRLQNLLHRLQCSVVIALDQRPPLLPMKLWITRLQLDEILVQPYQSFGTLHHAGQDTAYIIFTSGSTSDPKGVEITVGSLIAYFGNHNEVLRFTPDSRVFSLSPFHFDVSIEDTLLPLSLGAFVYQYRQLHAGALMRTVLIREQITHLIAVSTLLTLITEDGRHISSEKFPHLQMVMTGAEICDPGLINLWKSRLPTLRIINAYGPTEATIVCLTHEISEIEVGRKISYPIGKPLRNVAMKIMTKDGEIYAPGLSGELLIGGEQVMRGYFDQPEENRRVLEILDGVRYYRTGDVCCYDEQGNVIFQGRSDDEVKINGRRIHLGEIRQRALSYEGVERAAVTVIRRNGRDCIGLVIMSAELRVAIDVERYFKDHLPDYMIPNIVAWSPATEINSSGKTDERVLSMRLRDAVKLSGSNYFALSNAGVFEPFKEAIHA